MANIQTNYRNERSERGYNLSELISGLQKYIRRGMEDQALKCVQELYGFSWVEGGQRIWTNAIHRLQLIFLEDIGLGNLGLWSYMVDWIDFLKSERKKDMETRDRIKEVRTIERMVRHLCRSKKTRAGSFMNMVGTVSNMYCDSIEAKKAQELGCWFPMDPDRTTPLNPTYELFTWLESLEDKLQERHPKAISVFTTYFKRCNKVTEWIKRLTDMMSDYIDMNCTKAWKKDIFGLKEGFLLYLMPLGQHLFGSETLQIWEDREVVQFNGVFPSDWTMKDFVLDDFVLDKHTRNAKNRTTSFVTESSKVTNEVARTPPEWKSLYEFVLCQ